MKLTIIGAGYVGLVTGVGFALKGNEVCCVEIDKSKVDAINKGVCPIYEKDLEFFLGQTIKSGKLKATSSLMEGVLFSDIIFIAIGTPPKQDGSPDMSHIAHFLTDLSEVINHDKILINKSTVPVGSAKSIKETLERKLQEKNKKYHIMVLSNPEFLKEGDALYDFLYPDRVIIGGEKEDEQAVEILRKLYIPFVTDENKIIVMDSLSSEMTKYSANAMLATRISFINEMGRICSGVGANIEQVKIGIGSDKRIGSLFLQPGIGYGGSCFPKDVDALIHLAKENGEKPYLLTATRDSNNFQVDYFVSKIKKVMQSQEEKNLAVWGLSFKAGTDDIRESSAIKVLSKLSGLGYSLEVYDPESLENAKEILRILNIKKNNNLYDVLNNKQGLVILTDWHQFTEPNFTEIKARLIKPRIFDGRNILNEAKIKQEKIEYYSIGRVDIV